MLRGRRRLPISIGARVLRKIRGGHTPLPPGVFGVGARRAPCGVHVVELIALVNDRLGPRLSLRYFAHRRPLAGSSIANIIVGPQILPIGAQVTLITIMEVAAQVLSVRAKVGPVSREVLLISTNIGSVAPNIALVLRTITLVGIAIGVAR